MKILTEQERQAAKILLKSVNCVSSYTYNELSKMISPPVHHRTVLPKIIGSVSHLCFDLGLPLLSVKVLNQATGKADIGFYNLYCNLFPEGKNESPDQVEKRERERIQLWDDWSPLLDYLNLDLEIPISPKKVKQQIATAEPEIRILPMSKELEFKDYSVEDIQQKYFLGDLIHTQNGFYYFREVGMNCADGSLALFQFDNQIVACATLKRIHKYEIPVNGLYKGAFEFVSSSIETFEPICLEEITDIAPNIVRFSQVKQAIGWGELPNIRKLIAQKKHSIYPDDVTPIGQKNYVEGAKKEITVNAYERNPVARRECIKACGYRCIICGFDFGEVYGEQFAGKIHVHHKNPLYLVDNEYELNPTEDLAPVCPNCHMILHAKEDGVYTVEEVAAFIAANVTIVDRA